MYKAACSNVAAAVKQQGSCTALAYLGEKLICTPHLRAAAQSAALTDWPLPFAAAAAAAHGRGLQEAFHFQLLMPLQGFGAFISAPLGMRQAAGANKTACLLASAAHAVPIGKGSRNKRGA
eukprot:1143362-Pelagomonas_calceolata.AAC.1